MYHEEEPKMGDILKDEGQEGLIPIGVLEDGQFIWPIFGAEDDDPDDVPGDDPDDDEDEDEDDEPDSKSKNKKDKKDKSKDSDKDDEDDDDDESEDEDVAYWKSKAQRLQRQKEAADRRATAAERENRRLKQTDKDLLDEPGKQDLKEAQESVKSSERTVNNLRLQIALLSDNRYEWHDPSDVVRLLGNDDSVEIDEDGKVIGAKRAIDRLAKRRPYLVKSNSDSKSKGREEDDDDGDEEDDDEPATRRRVTAKTASGAAVGNRSRKSREAAERSKVIQKYPMLARR